MERELEAQLKARKDYISFYWRTGFDHLPMNAVTQEDPKHIDVVTWGIVEPWTKDINQRWKELRGKSLNTQAEHVFKNARSEEAILYRRCIIPVTGYFEPYYIKSKSYPHIVKPIHETYLGLLGIYNEIDGIKYASILTADANDFMKVVHNKKKRQPIMLKPYYWKTWANDTLSEGQLNQLMFQCDTDQELEAYTVLPSATTAQAKNNIPEVLERTSFPEVKAQQEYDIKELDVYDDNLDNLNEGEATSLFG